MCSLPHDHTHTHPSGTGTHTLHVRTPCTHPAYLELVDASAGEAAAEISLVSSSTGRGPKATEGGGATVTLTTPAAAAAGAAARRGSGVEGVGEVFEEVVGAGSAANPTSAPAPGSSVGATNGCMMSGTAAGVALSADPDKLICCMSTSRGCNSGASSVLWAATVVPSVASSCTCGDNMCERNVLYVPQIGKEKKGRSGQ